MAFQIVNGRVVPVGGSTVAAPAAAAAAPSSGGAKQVSNVGTNGADARFFVGPNSGLRRVDGGWQDANGSVFDDNGLWTGRGPNPTRVIPGLPPANESESYNVYTGEVKGGGGGGSAPGNPLGSVGSNVSDPFFNQVKSLLQSQSAGDLSNTRAAIQKALIGFGLVPGGFEDKLNALDDMTRNLIKQNTDSGISYYARMLEQKRDNLRSITSKLSQTGLRRSGTKGAKLRRAQLDADRVFADSLSELLGQVGGMYSGYANNEAGRQMQLLQALQNAQGNFWTGQGSTVGAGGGGGSWNPGPNAAGVSTAAPIRIGSGPSFVGGGISLGGVPTSSLGGSAGGRFNLAS